MERRIDGDERRGTGRVAPVPRSDSRMPRRGVRHGKRVQGETAAKRWCLPASKESAPRRGASAANGGASLSACIESGNLSLLRDRDNYIMKIERDI